MFMYVTDLYKVEISCIYNGFARSCPFFVRVGINSLSPNSGTKSKPFTNGHVVDGDLLTMYYGAADEIVCGACFSISEILSVLS
jgi:hypothetical protein